MAEYGRYWDAYTAAGDLLYELIEQGAVDPPGEVSEGASQRMSLTAGILQSIEIVEQTITCGLYWSAAALLRQHMEALARVAHIRLGKTASNGRPPHVGVLPFRLAQNHGRLSELVHVSNGELLGDFAASGVGELVASPFPRYRGDWANDLLAVHTAHMITLAIEIHHLHADLYPGRELLDVNSRAYAVAEVLSELGQWKELNEVHGGEPGREGGR